MLLFPARVFSQPIWILSLTNTFPPKQTLLKTAKEGNKFSITIDPFLLINLFKVINPILDTVKNFEQRKRARMKITFPLDEGNHPQILISAKNEDGMEIEALLSTCKTEEED